MSSALVSSIRNNLNRNRPAPAAEKPKVHDPDQQFVTLNMYGQDVNVGVECEAIATDGTFIHLVSAIGSASTIKAISTGLRSPLSTKFRCDNAPVKLANDGANGVLQGYMEGWEIHKHLLGMNSWHLLAWSKWPKMLPVGDDETLWRRLRSEEFTTPLLRSWVPEIRHQLMEHNLLRKLNCFGCDSYYLASNSKGLDSIVSAGVLSGKLKLE